MVELLLLLGLILPQTIAGIFAKSLGRSFWFWFFISFLIPIISLIILVFLDDKNEENVESVENDVNIKRANTGYKLADHVYQKEDQ
ncbi:hypothetical protein [Pedobacter metabolipauper]|uniref:Uncharacterized protein n=1 Tax=Pedobacter metabolipauper TaxID=425513 RepID=A0A4R6SYI4_9SPHI|nr:hypothetical protein [Pedobacter metabolipauper]TDQ11092.1 hypothetical protein ATK78_0206 [Pedobacter metabolipauper]